MNFAHLGGTLTGGTSVDLIPAGLSANGKSTYLAPGSNRLEPRTIDFFVTAPTTTKNDPGVARSGFKVAFANREVSEGCCNVAAGTVIIDVSVRWPLSQPQGVLDDAISYARSAIMSSEFNSSAIYGTLPTT